MWTFKKAQKIRGLGVFNLTRTQCIFKLLGNFFEFFRFSGWNFWLVYRFPYTEIIKICEEKHIPIRTDLWVKKMRIISKW